MNGDVPSKFSPRRANIEYPFYPVTCRSVVCLPSNIRISPLQNFEIDKVALWPLPNNHGVYINSLLSLND